MSDKKIIAYCTNIHKSFSLGKKDQSALNVLKGIDLEIYEGEVVSIVGASGSGKSTLLYILSGLDKPTQGNIYWLDKEISSLSDEGISKMRIRFAGFIFQFHHLLPEFTALENVMIPLMIAGKSLSESEKRAGILLTKVDLSNRLYHKPNELSGGEQQRVAVARALANKPQIIFADEPSGNLDSVNSQQLHDLLWELNRTEKQTFVIVTHNDLFAQSSERIFRMQDGKLHLM
jgi:lipoprotein-releasing system ATP-binding protein